MQHLATSAPVASGPSSGAERLPDEPGLSGFRSIFKYALAPLRRFEDARALSDRAVAFRLLGVPYILIFDPEAIEQVLVTRHSEFQKDQYTRDLRRVLGMGLLTSDGDEWRRRRKLAAPSFQRAEIASYGPIMVGCAERFVESCESGKPFDVHSALMHLTLDILVQALFGTRIVRAHEVELLLDRLMKDALPISEALRSVLPEWFPVPSRGRVRRISAELDDVLFELILERKAALEASASNGAPSESSSVRTDLLTRLMRARDDGGGLTDAALRDEAMTLFLAGHETTALALTFTLRLLALHPEPRAKLHAELDEVLAGRAPSFDDLSRLTYTRAVIDEAMRLYPPAWAIAREPIADVVVTGIQIARGTQVLLSPWIMQRDARFFAAPEQFQPERWSGPPPARFTYFPFGAGPRVCIGQHFAIAEAVLLLATFAQRAEFTLEAGRDLRLFPAVTLRPRDPVMMRMQRR
jgi:cytochrome P450